MKNSDVENLKVGDHVWVMLSDSECVLPSRPTWILDYMPREMLFLSKTVHPVGTSFATLCLASLSDGSTRNMHSDYVYLNRGRAIRRMLADFSEIAGAIKDDQNRLEAMLASVYENDTGDA